jgi:uncharacterized membrane protein HdeD (DUF308 family)
MSAATHHTNHWTTSQSDWWHAASWGIAGVIVGLFLMTQPIASAIILMTVLAGFLVLGGVVDILHAVVSNTEGWLWHIGGGVLIYLWRSRRPRQAVGRYGHHSGNAVFDPQPGNHR